MSDKKKMTFKELRDYLCEYNRTHNWAKEVIKAVVVFTPDSFEREYSEESRSYEVRSDNNTFRNSISNSLFGYCLDGTDQGVRLDAYMGYYGNKPGWKVDYCYLIGEEKEVNKMKLYDYLTTLEEGTELTVWDKDYDMESYFYNDEPDDEDDNWQTSMLELAKLLDVTKVKERGVVVNLSEVIEKKLNKLKEADLFIRCTVDSIMNDMENILSGYVSEEWFKKFVNVLGGKES